MKYICAVARENRIAQKQMHRVQWMEKRKEMKKNGPVISARCLLKIALYLVAVANPASLGRERYKSGRIAIIRCLSPFFSNTTTIRAYPALRR